MAIRLWRRIEMPPADDLADCIAEFLDAHHVMSLATCGPHGPHAANVFYARDGFSLLWVSDPQSTHSTNIGINPQVGATIAPDDRAGLFVCRPLPACSEQDCIDRQSARLRSQGDA